ncbi:arsenate reductase family protein [Croceiramulus getboli]|nr:hypothetical protein P8624_12005 [Flavobacteriaceae bacterium YJPT1-3]
MTIADDERQLTLYYSSTTRIGKHTHSYAQGTKKELNAIDIAKTEVAGTTWAELAKGIGAEGISGLIAKDHPDTPQKFKDANYDDKDWIKILNDQPDAFQFPIAINGGKFKQITNPTEILEFFSVDSAGLEKHNVGDEPTIKSQTEDENFVKGK